jgi:UDP-N-acetylmuramate--alanine ligase
VNVNLSDLRIHIMGIGGAGMSAIARILKARGVSVSGDDRSASAALEALNAEGIPSTVGHSIGSLDGVDVVAPSSAVAQTEPALVEARARGINIWHRGDLLNALLQDKVGIAIAGTHGKTSTTAMTALVLMEAGVDPSYIIGATVPGLGNARHGDGEAFVLEADEYDRTFLRYEPNVAVITNVEFDHPDTFADLNATRDAFTQFAQSVPAGGVVIACADDEGATDVVRRLTNSPATVVTYGIDRGEWRATNVRANTLGGMDFSYRGPSINGGDAAGSCTLRVSGNHNVQNALAALAVADACGIPASQAAETLATYRGAERRFELKGEARGVRVIDDYAHNPTKIRATLAAARLRYPVGRIVAVWQPHTYSRTVALMNDFAVAFKDADEVIVLPVYAAREKPEDLGFDAAALNPIEISRKIKHPRARNAASFGDAVGMLISQIKGGDVIITLSAGDGNVVGSRVLDMLKG